MRMVYLVLVEELLLMLFFVGWKNLEVCEGSLMMLLEMMISERNRVRKEMMMVKMVVMFFLIILWLRWW